MYFLMYLIIYNYFFKWYNVIVFIDIALLLASHRSNYLCFMIKLFSNIIKHSMQTRRIKPTCLLTCLFLDWNHIPAKCALCNKYVHTITSQHIYRNVRISLIKILMYLQTCTAYTGEASLFHWQQILVISDCLCITPIVPMNWTNHL